jgi:hypothetical protein
MDELKKNSYFKFLGGIYIFNLLVSLSFYGN